MELTYVGHSAVQVEGSDGTRLLIDPWIEGNPHTDRTVDSFTDVDGVLVTHAAHDHLGDAPAIAEANDVTLVCDMATEMMLTERGDVDSDRLQPYIWGPVYEEENWSVKIVEANHTSVAKEANLIGQALAYIVHLDGERVYHMGDTSISRDFELFGDLYEPTVLLVPVGEAVDQYVELHPDEAALVVDWIEPDVAVPIHYKPGADHPEQFLEECEARGVTSEIRRMEPGEVLHR